jgi:hypothetical protein
MLCNVNISYTTRFYLDLRAFLVSCGFAHAWGFSPHAHAGSGALCVAFPRRGTSVCVSVPTTSVLILESDVAHAPYCTNDCLYCHATRRKLKLETAYDSQREIWHMRASPACVKYHAADASDTKMGTEVVGTLTHADAPHRGNAPYSAPRPAFVCHAFQ